MTVTNGQADGQASEASERETNRRIAGIFHDAGIRHDNELLRAAAETDPGNFAGVRDALKDVQAEIEAAT